MLLCGNNALEYTLNRRDCIHYLKLQSYFRMGLYSHSNKAILPSLHIVYSGIWWTGSVARYRWLFLIVQRLLVIMAVSNKYMRYPLRKYISNFFIIYCDHESWHSTVHEISCLFEHWRFITVFAKASYWILSQANRILSRTDHRRWTSSREIGRKVNNPFRKECYRNIQCL
jgi:hypothetical protein